MFLMIDFLGSVLAKTTFLPGRKALMSYWEKNLDTTPLRFAKLPNGCRVSADLRIPYERQVFLRKEEFRELVYLRSLLKPGDVFVDIGSNIGLWALSASKAVGRSRHVFSLEPNPDTYQKLISNISLNNATNISAFPFAATDVTGQVTFCCYGEHNLSAIF